MYYVLVFNESGNEVFNAEYDNYNDAVADSVSWSAEGYTAEVCKE